MINVIVPLAGPDFVSDKGVVKGLLDFKGTPLLQAMLKSRPWSAFVENHNYIFVLMDSLQTRDFALGHLALWYPGCKVVFVSEATRGAAFSALAGMSLIKNMQSPVIVDLADIGYEVSLNPLKSFEENADLGAIALGFTSSSPAYSYLRLGPGDSVISAAEKRVISNCASAGTYLFRTPAVYAGAIAHAICHEDEQTYNGLFYVCPLVNGVVAQQLKVKMVGVNEVVDVKTDQSGY